MKGMDQGKVLVAGTFDILHPGHLHLFAQARARGKTVVAVVAKDATVEKLKGRKPYFSESERVSLVGALREVDRAILGHADDFYEVVREEAPDCIVLGYDQWPDERELRARLDEMGLRSTRIYRAQEKDPERFKSSKIRSHVV